MAKRGKYHKVSRFAFDGLDVKHYRTTEAYAQAVQTLFDRAAQDVAMNCAKIKPGDAGFSFDDYPSASKHMARVCKQLSDNVTATITRGSRKQWLFACSKNDDFLNAIMDTSKIRKSTLQKMQDRNLDALATFQDRKVGGMALSQRVWKYVGEWREHMEIALDVGLGEGTSAAQLARNVRQDLRDPERLFRRVRGADGKLRLSKAAQAFHPGQGVYRSSVRNAQRLTRSEINMAYRESDFLRWQQLDFVVGFEIKRSNHRPLCKCALCERLAGRYPKTFKFVGWHPQCMCKAIPILMDDETFDANELGELRAALRGEEYHAQQAKNVVTDVPDGFREWMAENAERQANWKNVPYFVRDNFANGKIADGLKIKLPSVDEETGKVSYHKPFDQLSDREQADFYNFLSDEEDYYDLESACRLYGVDMSEWVRMRDNANDNPAEWYWRKNDIIAARNHVEQVLKQEIARVKVQAEQFLNDFAAVVKEADGWIGEQQSVYDYALNMFKQEQAEKYPNYIAIVKSATSGSALNVVEIRKEIAQAKADYAQAIADAKSCIAKHTGKVDVSKLQSLVNEQRTTTRNSLRITNEIKKEIDEVERKWNEAQNGVLSGAIDDLAKKKVLHRPVADLPKELTTDEIITRLGGGDMTTGSCSSLAFAFAANRGKMDVLDFRGGESLQYFSRTYNIANIVTKVGGVRQFNVSGVEMMKQTEIGKEYYLSIGRHAAIVRQVSKGKYEYLELQSATNNGWHPLNAAKFGWRFSARGREWSAEMVEVSKLYADASFRKLMGYINTASDAQKKSDRGTIK